MSGDKDSAPITRPGGPQIRRDADDPIEERLGGRVALLMMTDAGFERATAFAAGAEDAQCRSYRPSWAVEIAPPSPPESEARAKRYTASLHNCRGSSRYRYTNQAIATRGKNRSGGSSWPGYPSRRGRCDPRGALGRFGDRSPSGIFAGAEREIEHVTGARSLLAITRWASRLGRRASIESEASAG